VNMFRAQCALAVTLGALIATPATADHHFMQIHQVMAGVNGDTSAQAIQLRMRSAFQNQMQSARMRVWDAAGQNPVMLIDFMTPVANGQVGDTVLIVSSDFIALTDPTCQPDYLLENLIPESYLTAGSITFENNAGTFVWWRLSWGGDAYTGPRTGEIANDLDGDFGVYPDPLPTGSLQALRFQGAANARSTNNAADYALTAGAAVFQNNADATFTVVGAPAGPICPASSIWFNSSTNNGNAAGVCGSDDSWFAARRATFTPSFTTVLTNDMRFEGVQSDASSLIASIEVSIDNSAVGNVRVRLILKNQAGGADRTIVSGFLSTTDQIVMLTEDANAADFIDADGSVQVEAQFLQTTGAPNWIGRIDESLLDVQ
jgi:hypothetical protein